MKWIIFFLIVTLLLTGCSIEKTTINAWLQGWSKIAEKTIDIDPNKLFPDTEVENMLVPSEEPIKPEEKISPADNTLTPDLLKNRR